MKWQFIVIKWQFDKIHTHLNGTFFLFSVFIFIADEETKKMPSYSKATGTAPVQVLPIQDVVRDTGTSGNAALVAIGPDRSPRRRSRDCLEEVTRSFLALFLMIDLSLHRKKHLSLPPRCSGEKLGGGISDGNNNTVYAHAPCYP
jgi:hypothetical protein